MNILPLNNQQKTLFFLIKNPLREYLEKDIQKATKISKAGTNLALADLLKRDLVTRQRRGNVYFYKVDCQDPVIKQLKVLQNVVALKPLVDNLKEDSREVILFGSAARGEDTGDSDIDLFVLADDIELINDKVRETKNSRKIQLVAKTPPHWLTSKMASDVFKKEVEGGIILYAKK